MRGVFLDVGSLAQPDIDLSPLGHESITWGYYDFTPQDAVIERVAEADIVVTNKVTVNGAALAAAKKLKLVCIAATGANNVDLDEARRCGVTVCNVRGYATPSVVEHVFALMLALMRHLPDYQRAVKSGRWQRSRHFSFIDFPINELNGKALGIVGYGELGRAVAKGAEAFGMRILIAERPGVSPRIGRATLTDLLPQVDVLSLHCPLTPETRGLIGIKELQLMKRGAILINTARGGIVDEAAVAEVLRSGRLGGAGIDVLAQEPPAENPLLGADVPNLIVTPHIA
jgi:glycerate dehydrogenase